MPLPIALDYRPALLSRAGIGRATRELAAALAHWETDGADALRVHLFGHSLAAAKIATTTPPAARLHRAPLPGRALPLLARCGLSAERLAGSARVFHWTDYVQPPVRAARTVLTVHDLAFVRDERFHGADSAALQDRTRAAILRADAVVTPSRVTADDVRAFAPDGPTPVVIPFGADHVPEVEAPDPLGGRPFALCVGTIEPRKNHLTLLRAWRRLRVNKPLLVVVGGVGWECTAIVRELEKATADGVVDWRPAADDATLWALLRHARLLAYPSLWEGFGFPPLEAMALGVPVVAHDCAPMQELGEAAIERCDATDEHALAAAFERVLGDRGLQQELAVAGRRRAAAFRWRDCAAAHARLYRELAS